MLPSQVLVSAYIEDSVLGFWCQNQVESPIVGEVPVINQKDLILWVALSDERNLEFITFRHNFFGNNECCVFELILATTRKLCLVVIWPRQWTPE